LLNLSTVQLEELETLVTSWGFPKYRASQVYHWIRQHGITDVNDMKNIPKDLKQKLSACTQPTSLRLVLEQISQKDGTIKRAYQCQDGQIIESVLMAYEDGRYTACISSQAGCAQGRYNLMRMT
jgi:23S rRNA (adenine2503-C2)-methyltransferase